MTSLEAGSNGRSNGARAPVILVPGFSGQDLVYWNLFHRRFDKDGFRSFSLSLPGLALADIRRSGKLLAARVDAVLDRTNADQLHLVGHSLGGLIIREYVQNQGGADKVDVCGFLGTPHQGTWSASLGAPLTACRQMLPNSSYLRELATKPVPPHWINVYAPRDSLVVPWRNAKLPGAENYRVKYGGHWGLLVKREAYRAVLEAMLEESGRPVATPIEERSADIAREGATPP